MLCHTLTEVSGREGGIALRNHPSCQVWNQIQTLQSHDALRILVQLYSQNKDYKSVLKTISRLEVEEGESEQFTLSKMRVYELMNDKKAAYQELKSLVDQHPLDMQYKTMLGNWPEYV